jgi:hypothetical protein
VAHFQDLQIPRLTSRSSNKEIQTRLFTQRYVFRTFSGQTGGLKFFTPAWEMITQDPWTLQVIQGYQKELVTPPVQQSLPNVPKLSSTQETVLEQEVKELLMKQAIHPVQSPKPESGFISSIFVVPKKDGGNRPVVNLKPPEPVSRLRAFQDGPMEGIHMLRDLLKKGDFLVKIDPKDAYLAVPIWKNHQKYLRFLWKDTMLEFACLPIGLATARRVFYQAYEAGSRALRQRGLHSPNYIFRRYPNYGRISRSSITSCSLNPESPRGARLHSKLSEVRSHNSCLAKRWNFWGF